MLSFKKVRRFVGTAMAVFGLAAAGLGCAFGEIRWDDPMGRLLSLEETQMYYSQLVRFNDYNTALRFVDPELRETYLERQNMTLRFTDLQSGPIDLEDGHRKSNVTVTYLGYEPNVLIERAYTEKQAWFRDPPGNNWFVRPYFVDLEEEPPPRVVADASASLEDPEKAKDRGPAQ